jgi:glutathione S-transferase
VLIDGAVELFDSTQIFEYLEDIKPVPSLWPSEPKLRARARQLELLSDEVLFPHVSQLMSRARSGEAVPLGPESAAILAYYGQMDAVLAGQNYLVGEFSYADIALYMAHYFAQFLGAPIPSEQKRLIDWQRRVNARDSVQRVTRPMKDFLYARSK